ncbi:MAG TPA: hypothetical protein VKQ11_00660 [Candidatus Sulfotelmatobacter sp.]|nr:hypothetical protein [Candidatus Sulfotelmatobacter sp.]
MSLSDEELARIIQTADAYILALRQAFYSAKPEVRAAAEARLNDLGSRWLAVRVEYCDIPEATGVER